MHPAPLALRQSVATFAQAGANVDLDALLEEYGLPVRRVEGLRRVRLASGDSPQEAPGFVQGQLYADALADRLLERLPDPLEGLEEELARAGSYEEVRAILQEAMPAVPRAAPRTVRRAVRNLGCHAPSRGPSHPALFEGIL